MLAESLDLQDGDEKAGEHAAVDYGRFIRPLSAIFAKFHPTQLFFQKVKKNKKIRLVAQVCGLG